MIAAICHEINLTPLYPQNNSISSVYFGGGTPSILNYHQLEEILKTVKHKFRLETEAEITLEANPDDITRENLEAWLNMGFNRLSLGIQSFNEEELRWMNRAHHAWQSLSSLELIKASGITNYSIDLIYGSNLQPNNQLLKNLDIINNYRVPHISCYGLTVEPKTKLQHLIETGKELLPDEQLQARQFLLIMKWMRENGYEHYEVSNYALPGKRSRHNSSYWQGLSYYGFGPSAHGYDGNKVRRWNISNNSQYIKSIEQGIIPSQMEELSLTQQMNEYVMTSLRTLEGISLQKMEESWGIEHRQRLESSCEEFIITKKLIKKNAHLFLTDEGMLMADGMASDLFIV